jgi:hypothetical protein
VAAKDSCFPALVSNTCCSIVPTSLSLLNIQIITPGKSFKVQARHLILLFILLQLPLIGIRLSGMVRTIASLGCFVACHRRSQQLTTTTKRRKKWRKKKKKNGGKIKKIERLIYMFSFVVRF